MSLTEDLERYEAEAERVQDEADEALRERSAATLQIADDLANGILIILELQAHSTAITLDAIVKMRAAIDKLEEL